MKKFISLILCITLIISCFCIGVSADETAAPDSGVTINVYNWGEYISNGTDGSMDVNAEFTRRTGIQVNYTTFDSNESLYAKLAGGGADYDIIIPSEYMVARLIEEGMLAELNFDNIPNFKYIDEKFRDPSYDPGSAHSVPYTWGLVGLFSFDLVAWIFGGSGMLLSRIVYTVIALAGVWCISLLFRGEHAHHQVSE